MMLVVLLGIHQVHSRVHCRLPLLPSRLLIVLNSPCTLENFRACCLVYALYIYLLLRRLMYVIRDLV